MNVSIRPELDIAEQALSTLCEEVQHKTTSVELRKEYQTLLAQATSALNRVRSIAETDDFIRHFAADNKR